MSKTYTHQNRKDIICSHDGSILQHNWKGKMWKQPFMLLTIIFKFDKRVMQWGYLDVVWHLRKLSKKLKDQKVCMTCSTNDTRVFTKLLVKIKALFYKKEIYQANYANEMWMKSIFYFKNSSRQSASTHIPGEGLASWCWHTKC